MSYIGRLARRVTSPARATAGGATDSAAVPLGSGHTTGRSFGDGGRGRPRRRGHRLHGRRMTGGRSTTRVSSHRATHGLGSLQRQYPLPRGSSHWSRRGRRLRFSVELQQLVVVVGIVGAHFFETHVLRRVDAHVVLQLRTRQTAQVVARQRSASNTSGPTRQATLNLCEKRAELQVLLLGGAAARRRRAALESGLGLRRRLLRETHGLRGSRRVDDRERAVSGSAHLRDRVDREQPRHLPRVEHMHEAFQVFARHLRCSPGQKRMSTVTAKPHTPCWLQQSYLTDAVAVQRHDHARKQRRVRPADVLEDRVRQVEDRELEVGWRLP